MQIVRTEFHGLYIIEPKVFKDKRGYFFECYNKGVLNKNGIYIEFVQDNQSQSSYGVIRGLHHQRAPFAQTKLIRVLKGKILDVVVDLRKNSPTFAKVFSLELSDEDHKQLLIPKGFAHGFSVLSDIAVIHYKCDELYVPEAEGGINHSDPELNIDWKIPKEKRIISEKDSQLPNLSDARINFL